MNLKCKFTKNNENFKDRFSLNLSTYFTALPKHEDIQTCLSIDYPLISTDNPNHIENETTTACAWYNAPEFLSPSFDEVVPDIAVDIKLLLAAVAIVAVFVLVVAVMIVVVVVNAPGVCLLGTSPARVHASRFMCERACCVSGLASATHPVEECRTQCARPGRRAPPQHDLQMITIRAACLDISQFWYILVTNL